jgi:hypothetical protein
MSRLAWAIAERSTAGLAIRVSFTRMNRTGSRVWPMSARTLARAYSAASGGIRPRVSTWTSGACCGADCLMTASFPGALESFTFQPYCLSAVCAGPKGPGSGQAGLRRAQKKPPAQGAGLAAGACGELQQAPADHGEDHQAATGIVPRPARPTLPAPLPCSGGGRDAAVRSASSSRSVVFSDRAGAWAGRIRTGPPGERRAPDPVRRAFDLVPGAARERCPAVVVARVLHHHATPAAGTDPQAAPATREGMAGAALRSTCPGRCARHPGGRKPTRQRGRAGGAGRAVLRGRPRAEPGGPPGDGDGPLPLREPAARTSAAPRGDRKAAPVHLKGTPGR